MGKLGEGVRGIRNQIISALTLDWGDRHQTVLLAGAGRSGTTWVQGLINGQNDYRVMFEPFQPWHIDLVKDWHQRQYVRQGDRSPQFLDPASQILSGQIRHPWIDKFNRKIPASKRLIKEIRAQLLLKWLHQNFPEIPIIFILRHPCAVASSRLNLGWGTLLPDFLAQDELMEDFLEPFRGIMETTRDPFEQHVLNWCIENYVPLCQFEPGEVCVAFYEPLCLAPQREMERIFEFMGSDGSANNLLELSSRPSAVSRKDSAVVSGGNLINAWRRHVTEAQLERALEICHLFGLQAIYGAASLPQVSGKEALQLFSPPAELRPERRQLA